MLHVILNLLQNVSVSHVNILSISFINSRKAIKGTLVLSPLLGVIYLLIFFVPPNTPVWYQYFLRIAYPMQVNKRKMTFIHLKELSIKIFQTCKIPSSWVNVIYWISFKMFMT